MNISFAHQSYPLHRRTANMMDQVERDRITVRIWQRYLCANNLRLSDHRFKQQVRTEKQATSIYRENNLAVFASIPPKSDRRSHLHTQYRGCTDFPDPSYYSVRILPWLALGQKYLSRNSRSHHFHEQDQVWKGRFRERRSIGLPHWNTLGSLRFATKLDCYKEKFLWLPEMQRRRRLTKRPKLFIAYLCLFQIVLSLLICLKHCSRCWDPNRLPASNTELYWPSSLSFQVMVTILFSCLHILYQSRHLGIWIGLPYVKVGNKVLWE